MKRTLIALSMFGLVMVTSSPVFAKNASNTNFDTYNSLTPNWYYKVLR